MARYGEKVVMPCGLQAAPRTGTAGGGCAPCTARMANERNRPADEAINVLTRVGRRRFPNGKKRGE